MTSPVDLERILPSLQDRFAISVVHLTEYHEAGILVQKDLENGRRQPYLSPGPRCRECNHHVGVGKDCSRLQNR